MKGQEQLYYNSGAVPEECLHVNTKGACERNTCYIGEATPSVLYHVEQNEEKRKEEQVAYDANHEENFFGDVVTIVIWFLVNLVPCPLIVAVRYDNATQKKSKHKPSNVSKVVNVRQESYYQQHK